MSASLVGSEMCIRDRSQLHPAFRTELPFAFARLGMRHRVLLMAIATRKTCLLYTSDAADDM
eukprot:492331-Alexandrium_andersonii.AAC.1